jgi:glycosyltransferase involved in cell wall biosynthesis/Tfp pilus assembly protein PilF
MRCPQVRRRFVIFHKDHPFSPLGIHSGAEMGTIHLARSLARRGARVTVLGRLTSGDARVDEVEYVDLGDRYDIAAGLARIADGTDMLIAVTRADVLVRSLALPGIAKRVLWLQDSDLHETHATAEQIEEAVDRVVYVSQALRDHLESGGLPAALGEVIPNGFDPQLFHPADGKVHPHRVVYAGALVQEKGVDLLIEAFVLLRARLPEAELWLYGSPGLWGRTTWSLDPDRVHSLEPRIHFPGSVRQTEIASAFRAAAVAVVPSRRSARFEPFPLSAVEAQACGCPVVVTRNGGLPEGIVPGETGFVLENEDPRTLADVLYGALSERERLARMRIAAATHAARRFDWTDIAESFERLAPRPRTPASTHSIQPARDAKHSIAVFFVRPPQPDRYGGDFRAYRLIRALAAAGHRVTLFARDALTSPEETRRYCRMYEEVGVEVRVLTRVAGPVETLEEVLAGRHFDTAWILWWILGLEILPQLRRLLPGTRMVVDSVDVAYLRLLRQARVSESREDWLLAANTKRQELKAYAFADALMTVTDEDRATLCHDLPGAEVFVVPNVHGLPDTTTGFERRRGLLFVGYYDHPPNADAAVYFVTHIFPAIKRRLPDVILYLVGNAPPPAVQALARNDVIVTGYVPDISQFWQGARLSIAPLRYGAGMKGKIGQSMAEGLPVVTTSVGAEGMELTHGEHVLIADEPAAFADAVVEAYTDRQLWERVARAGRDLVRTRWSDEVVLEQLLDALLDRRTSERDTANCAGVVHEAVQLSRLAEGYEWLDLGCFAAARHIFESATAQPAEAASAFAGLAEIAETEGRDDEALGLWREAVERTAGNVTFRARFARLLRRAGQTREAIAQLEEASRSQPGDPLVVRELGQLAKDAGRDLEATRFFRTAMEKRPHDRELLEGVADVLSRNGQPAPAYHLLLQALAFAHAQRASADMRAEIVTRILAVERQLEGTSHGAGGVAGSPHHPGDMPAGSTGPAIGGAGTSGA